MPYLDMNLEYYDLGLKHRDDTDDQVTVDAAQAIDQARRGREVRHDHPQRGPGRRNTSLKKEWKSPNGTIRAMLDGTVFRAPIIVEEHPAVRPRLEEADPSSAGTPTATSTRTASSACAGPAGRSWSSPAKDGQGDLPAAHPRVQGARDRPGHPQHRRLDRAASPRPASPTPYDQKMDLWFGTKDTISKTYDARFKRHLRRRSTRRTGRTKFAGGRAASTSSRSSTTPWRAS